LENTIQAFQRQHVGKFFNAVLRGHLPLAAIRHMEDGFAYDCSELVKFSARSYHPSYSSAKVKEKNYFPLR